MTSSFAIIISGPPCTGKTTLGQYLSSELSLPFLSKDRIKESLFDTLGWGDREWSRKLGRATMQLLYLSVEIELAAGRSFIVESNFKSELATPQFLGLKSKYNFQPFQIQCQTQGDVLVARFKQRTLSGERHPGHVDHISFADVEPDLGRGYYDPLDIGGSLFILDTTDLTRLDYTDLSAAIRSTWTDLP